MKSHFDQIQDIVCRYNEVERTLRLAHATELLTVCNLDRNALLLLQSKHIIQLMDLQIALMKELSRFRVE
ncbi:hypothetical protein SAMN04487996_12278 [Dyadobacter soli]|uniref:Uncharacterized protein n=1 Tax=Dyadobacter soli TaxID=659014 RepID=A0A1G7WK43_9BACT|nr:hypothetical protein SAMN04487996_12278 [Dyadobacter soli]